MGKFVCRKISQPDMKRLAQAVSELHHRKIAWRDAHLGNVMCITHCDGNVDVTLIDFGPAQLMPSGT